MSRVARPVVAVIGAGPGGLAVAARSALSGCVTRVHDIDDAKLAPLRDAGGLSVEGVEEGFAPIAAATTEARAVIEHADLIVVCVPGDRLESVAHEIAPHLRGEQVVLVKPGCTAGAIQLRTACAVPETVTFAEADAFAFGCSVPRPASVSISLVKRSFGIAAIPAERTDVALALSQHVFPEARAAASVLETGLANMNAVLHVAPMIANAGRIELEGESFDFYGEGVTPSVARVMAAHDRDRLAVASALGVAVPSLLAWMDTTYGIQATDIYDGVGRLSREIYGTSLAPSALEHRYLTEDVPCSAVPIAELGEQLGVDVAATAQSVTLASSLLGRDLRAEGRTLARIGLAGLDRNGIRRAVHAPSATSAS